MNTKKILSAAFIAALIATTPLPGSGLCAQTFDVEELPAEKSPDEKSNDPVELVISYGGNNEVRLPSYRGVFEPVTVQPNHLMPFSLQFPADKVQMPVAIGALDGGDIIPMASVQDVSVTTTGIFDFTYERAEELFVDNEGIVRFAFQSPPQSGLYRVVVQLPGEQHILVFHVRAYGTPDQPLWHH